MRVYAATNIRSAKSFPYETEIPPISDTNHHFLIRNKIVCTLDSKIYMTELPNNNLNKLHIFNIFIIVMPNFVIK